MRQSRELDSSTPPPVVDMNYKWEDTNEIVTYEHEDAQQKDQSIFDKTGKQWECVRICVVEPKPTDFEERLVINTQAFKEAKNQEDASKMKSYNDTAISTQMSISALTNSKLTNYYALRPTEKRLSLNKNFTNKFERHLSTWLKNNNLSFVSMHFHK